jgi:hypothetical protein
MIIHARLARAPCSAGLLFGAGRLIDDAYPARTIDADHLPLMISTMPILARVAAP